MLMVLYALATGVSQFYKLTPDLVVFSMLIRVWRYQRDNKN